ncbi:MAG: phosphoribosylanthranilate isomerase [Halovenus sp.]
MSSVRVKLCGITRPVDREAAVDAGADAVGVISDVPVETPREVASDRAADLLADLGPFVTGVLVTMPDSVQAAVTLVERVDPDAVQVHDSLEPGQVGALRERVGVDVVAAVDAEGPVEAHADAADAVLVDSTDAAGGGGTGETHDWTRVADYVDRLSTPVILAGGLTPANVRDAVEQVDPYAVDTASGVERAGGIKDHNSLRQFVARVRGGGS